MSDSPIYGSDLAAIIQAQLGVVDALLTCSAYGNLDAEDIGNVAMVIKSARAAFNKLTPYLSDAPASHRLVEGGSHARQ